MPLVDDIAQKALLAVNIDDEGRACRDIPESACHEQGGNAFRHIVSLGLSKAADGLVDPKLVLSWLLTTLGAPAWMIGMLVPIRESGALLPQLFTAGYLRSLPRRKWVWSIGAALQGLSAVGMAIAGLTLDGAAAGAAILVCLTVLAFARSVCSVCYKDVLGKTVDKQSRGSVTGLASSLSAVSVIVYAVILSTGVVERMPLVLTGLMLAGAAWLGGSVVFLGLKEEKGATKGGKNAISAAFENLRYLKDSAQLRRFILTRGLLTATALAPPYMVAAAASEGNEAYKALGFLVLASAGSSLLSSYVWGWLSDRSSRKVLILSAVLGCLALTLTVWLQLSEWLAVPFVLPAVLFVLMIGYQGVRLGRSTHLVDMADDESRAAFTALSNTIIGVLLIAGSLFGIVASLAGTAAVLAIMAVMCGLAIFAALGLDEVQASDS